MALTKDWRDLPAALAPQPGEDPYQWHARIDAYAVANPGALTPLDAVALEDVEARVQAEISAPGKIVLPPSAATTATQLAANAAAVQASPLGCGVVLSELINQNAGGVKGLTLFRAAEGGANGLSFYTGATNDWFIGHDLNVGADGDLVLAFDAHVSADTLRMRHGGFLKLGNTAFPGQTFRFEIASTGATSEGAGATTLREMLRINVDNGDSPITHVQRAFVGGSAVHSVAKDGRLGVGNVDPAAWLDVNQDAVIDRDAIRLNRTADAPQQWLAWTQGGGMSDWRVGKHASAHDLSFNFAAGTPGTPAAPGTEFMRLDTVGRLSINRPAASMDAAVEVVAHSNIEVAMRVAGFGPSHTADLLRLVQSQNSSTPALRVTSAGQIAVGGIPAAGLFSNATISAKLTLSLSYPIMALRRTAGQTGAIVRAEETDGTILSQISANGYFMTRKSVAPPDADLANGEVGLWIDTTTGDLKVKSKTSGGVVKTATVAVA